MLCPKCDYISFDHITNCAKCNHDLTETASLLNGTSVNANQVNYLGSTGQTDLGDDASTQPDIDSGQENAVEMTDDEASASIDDALEEITVTDDFDPGLEPIAPLDLAGTDSDDEAVEGIDLELPPVLDSDIKEDIEFDADIDTSSISGLGNDANEENLDTDELSDNDGIPALEVPDLGGIDFVDSTDSQELEGLTVDLLPQDDGGLDAVDGNGEESQNLESIDSGELVLDDSALTLEIDDEHESVLEFEEVSAPESVETDSSDQTGIDLGNIDLSDLVHSLDSEAPVDTNDTVEAIDTGDESSSPITETDLSLTLESDDDESRVDDFSDPDGSIDLDSAAEDLIDLSVDDDDDGLDSLDLSNDGSDDELMDLSLELDDDK